MRNITASTAGAVVALFIAVGGFFGISQLLDIRQIAGDMEKNADDAADIVVTLARFGYTRLIVAAECESIVQIPVDEIEELLS